MSYVIIDRRFLKGNSRSENRYHSLVILLQSRCRRWNNVEFHSEEWLDHGGKDLVSWRTNNRTVSEKNNSTTDSKSAKEMVQENHDTPLDNCEYIVDEDEEGMLWISN